jgi:hypothetical protein
MPVVSLTDLQQQITQREQELQSLRRELESRQNHVTELTRRKEQLQRQLQQVEKEITAPANATPATTKQPQSVTSPSSSVTARATDQPRLLELIVLMLREGGRPMTAWQLSTEAQRRGFQPAGGDPVKSVKARLQELKNKGVVQRASGQPGYILAHSTNGASTGKSKPSQPAQTSTRKASSKPAKRETATTKRSMKGSSSAGSATMAKSSRDAEQPPLREVLTGILKNKGKPMSARELAEQILASGYRSDSKKFVKVVRTQLRKMANVQRMPDQEYRLQKKT